jgi:hypothetical protein
MDLEASNSERTFWKREAERFKANVMAQSPAAVVFMQVLDCSYFYDQYLKGGEDAPLILEKWLLPPSTAGRAQHELEKRVDDFARLNRIVTDAFPAMVSAVVECHEAAFARSKKEDAKARLGTLVDFIAALREKKEYRLRSDVKRKLTQADSRIRI